MDVAADRPRRAWPYRFVKRMRHRVNRWMADYSQIGDAPVLPVETFDWAAMLETHWRRIREEASACLAERHLALPLGDVSPDHRRLDAKRSWRTFFLWGYGYRVDENCRRAPFTAALVERIPGLVSAMFSLHEPGTHLPRHRGVTKGMITCHLGLKIPEDATRCRIRIAESDYGWRPGRAFLFDDTYPHEVWNETREDRVILLLHVKRPLGAPACWVRDLGFWMIRHSPFVQEPRRAILARSVPERDNGCDSTVHA